MTLETFHDGRVRLYGGDCRAVLASLPAASVDSVVTDPPYHLASIVKRFGKAGAAPAKSNGATGVYGRAARGFMGQTWDGAEDGVAIAHDPALWAEVLRVLKPGGHLVAFHAPKTWHRQAIAIEDAGFEVGSVEIRDVILSLFCRDEMAGRFLDSLTPGQAEALAALIDTADEGGALAWVFGTGFPKSLNVAKAIDKHLGVAPVVVGSVKRRDIRNGHGRAHGAGIHASTRGAAEYLDHLITTAGSEAGQRFNGFGTALKPAFEPIVLARKPLVGTVAETVMAHGTGAINVGECKVANAKGSWPTNLVHDDSAATLAGFGDPASARFFYSAKADSDDRVGSEHPTVKPIELMRWLVRLVTPPGGTILDPFAGTGTTAEAALREGFSAVLIEREATFRADIARRMALVDAGPVTRTAAIRKARGGSVDHGPLFGGADVAVGGGRTVYGKFARDKGSD